MKLSDLSIMNDIHYIIDCSKKNTPYQIDFFINKNLSNDNFFITLNEYVNIVFKCAEDIIYPGMYTTNFKYDSPLYKELGYKLKPLSKTYFIYLSYYFVYYSTPEVITKLNIENTKLLIKRFKIDLINIPQSQPDHYSNTMNRIKNLIDLLEKHLSESI